jgi:Multiubiquitin/Prokaryotic E2 family E
MKIQTESLGQGEALAEHAPVCHPAPKWMALVDDEPVPMPQRDVKVSVIKAQASVPPGFVLVRDHNSPDDVILGDDEIVDLSKGNVFYRLAACDAQMRGHCHAPPKLAFCVDDRPEVTANPNQTGLTLRELFSLAPTTRLFRDFESPKDEPIGLDEPVEFRDGPVFYTRRHHVGLTITVNSRPFTEADGVKPEMTGEEIAALVYPQTPRETKIFLRKPGKDRQIGLDEKIHIEDCEVFDVARCRVDGGYELARTEREVEIVRSTGAKVMIVKSPAPAVIYYGLRTCPGHPVSETDILVPIPSGYPGQFIDWAYLPEGSPLIGRVKGSPQNHIVSADGRQWQQISYHPHNGGGGPKWDQTVHGFHTYVSELVAWLYNAQ